MLDNSMIFYLIYQKKGLKHIDSMQSKHNTLAIQSIVKAFSRCFPLKHMYRNGKKGHNTSVLFFYTREKSSLSYYCLIVTIIEKNDPASV